jgi:hypothetical protein
VDIEEITFGEHDANVLRESFKPYERVRIAEKIEEAIRRKRGRPINSGGENQEKSPEFLKGKQTRDLVAEKAGTIVDVESGYLHPEAVEVL